MSTLLYFEVVFLILKKGQLTLYIATGILHEIHSCGGYGEVGTALSEGETHIYLFLKCTLS